MQTGSGGQLLSILDSLGSVMRVLAEDELNERLDVSTTISTTVLRQLTILKRLAPHCNANVLEFTLIEPHIVKVCDRLWLREYRQEYLLKSNNFPSWPELQRVLKTIAKEASWQLERASASIRDPLFVTTAEPGELESMEAMVLAVTQVFALELCRESVRFHASRLVSATDYLKDRESVTSSREFLGSRSRIRPREYGRGDGGRREGGLAQNISLQMVTLEAVRDLVNFAKTLLTVFKGMEILMTTAVFCEPSLFVSRLKSPQLIDVWIQADISAIDTFNHSTDPKTMSFPVPSGQMMVLQGVLQARDMMLALHNRIAWLADSDISAYFHRK